MRVKLVEAKETKENLSLLNDFLIEYNKAISIYYDSKYFWEQMGHDLFNSNATVYLIEFNSSIIGFTNVIKDGYRGDRIENIFIKEEFSNKGFGTETLISLFEKHKKLCLISHQGNKRAGHLFKKFAVPELVGVGELYNFNFEGKDLKKFQIK